LAPLGDAPPTVVGCTPDPSGALAAGTGLVAACADEENAIAVGPARTASASEAATAAHRCLVTAVSRFIEVSP
jgi:hypothetical protein